MKKNYFTLLLLILASQMFRAQTTETFESFTGSGSVKPTTFTSNSQPFTLTTTDCVNGGTFGIFIPGQTWNKCSSGTISNGTGAYGVGTSCASGNCTGTSSKFVENGASTGTSQIYSIKTTNSALITVKALHVYASTDQGNSPAASGVIFRGKKAGAVIFTVTKSSGMNTSFGTNNGFTYIDFSTEGGSNNTGYTIDELEVQGTGAVNYIAIDNFVWAAAVALSATQSQVNIACNGVCNGSASVSASNGSAPYTYAWSPSGGTGATASSLCAGNYTCTITDASSSTLTKTFTITQPTTLSATASSTNINCNGASTGAANVSASGGTAPYTYAWSPSGGSGSTASSLTAGNYTCTITDANNCSITKTFALTQPAALAATTAQTNISCNGASTGAANVSASGGTSPYTYAWSPSGGTGATASSLTAGNYTCTITDNKNCILPKTFNLTQPTALSATTTQTNISCNGGSTGAANVSASGGTAPYTYAWAPSGGSGSTASSLTAGNYTCTITDANNCSINKTFALTQPAALAATTTQTNIGCNGGSTGVANVSASGGTSPYTYAWAPSGGTGATASGLTAGNYTCTITDNKNCTLPKAFTLTQPAAMVATSTQTNISCNGGTTGAANVNVTSGGTAPFTYAWAPSGGTGSTASSLTAGNYTCTITDNNSCSITKAFTLTQPTALAATTSQTNISCNGASTGAANVSASGGTAPYTYAWAPSGGTGATASGLTAGNYTCTITDNNSCSITKAFNLTQPTALAATTTQTNIGCNGGSTGVANVSTSGGTSPYTYAWAPSGGTGATASGLTAGNYTCTITDNNSCSITKAFTLTQPAAMVATSTQTNITCNGGSTGAANVNVTSGGTAPFTYAWSPSGGTGSTASSLTAGNYTCTITDNNACSITKAFTLTQPTALSATTTQTNISCNGATNGAANVNVSGGTSPYTYAWAPSGGTAATASGLTAGNYTCTITDNNNCSITKAFALTQPAALAATTTQTNISCNGGSTGVANINASGGTAPYSYAWTPSGGTAATASGLAAGNYTCTITDNNSCSITKAFNLTQPTALTATTSQTNINCNGGTTGAANVSASGGTSPYTYAWLPSGGIAATASGLTAGNYTCTITDNNSCSITKAFTLTQPSAITATSTQTNINCNGSANGVANVNVTGGGTAPYTYAWSPSGGTAATASGLTAGNYTCTITDANTCSITKAFTLTQPTALFATTSQTNISCNGGSNGLASVNVSGGTAPYTYAWSPSGGTAATASGLTAGNYACTITDNQNCTLNKPFTLVEPSALAATTTQTNVNCNGGSTGASDVSVSGGTAPYSYAWSPSGGTAATASGLTAGNYTCSVTDNNSCSLTETISITEPAALTAIGSQTNVTCIGGGSDGAASVAVSGGTSPYSYAWSPSGGTAATASGLTAGNYTCTITDNNSCSTAQTFTLTAPAPITYTQTVSICQGQSISVGTSTYTAAGTYTNMLIAANACDSTVTTILTVNALPSLTITPSSTNICAGTSATLTAAGALTYTWSSGGMTDTEVVSPTSNMSYTVTGADVNNCMNTASVSITVMAAPVISVQASPTSVCMGQSLTLTASGGASTYTWTNGVTDGVAFTPSSTATYSVYATGGNGCTGSAAITVSVNPLPTVAAHSTSTTVCSGQQITLTGSGANTYTWTNSVSNGIAFTPSSTATYSVNATDINGCAGNAAISVTVNPLPTVVAHSTSSIVCSGQQITLTGSGASTYTWTNGVNNGVTFTPSVSATYTVTGTNTSGCANTAAISVTVTNCTGIDEQGQDNTVLVYPNPFSYSTFIHISNNLVSAKTLYVDLYDNTGRLVKHMLIEGPQTELTRENLSRGLYFYNVVSDKEVISKGKLIIE